MAFHLLPPPELVEALHDAALNPGDLPESALDKSRDGALARVENRLAYDLIGDAFVLAAPMPQPLRKVIASIMPTSVPLLAR